MGRYYSGDIEGKFWFGVQASDDASFFGGSEEEPNYTAYYFNTDDLKTIKKGITKCKTKLKGYKTKIDKFFKNCGGYTEESLAKEIATSTEKTKELLEWYARLELGQKILKCVKKQEYCSFDAEL